jgi:hypothetical protein
MLIEASCHCRGVRFRVHSAHPVPYQLCYCSVCRKTAGGGGCAINLGAEAATLEVEGRELVQIYRARIERDGQVEQSPAQRHFCIRCASALWVWDPRWPQLLHPFASAIDTPLPAAPERTHIMLAYRAPWIEPHLREGDLGFDEYPEESIAEWHERHGLPAS